MRCPHGPHPSTAGEALRNGNRLARPTPAADGAGDDTHRFVALTVICSYRWKADAYDNTVDA